MKILTIAATPFFASRGGHMRILNEAKYLQKLGAEVRLCTYHLGKNVSGLDIARIKGPQKYQKTSPGFSWGKVWLDLKLFFLVRREIKKFQPDAIHAHLFEGLAIGYLAKKTTFRKIPILLDLQGNLKEEFQSYNQKNNLARKFFVAFSKIVIRWADRIVVSSEKIKIDKKNTQVVRDGTDLDLFQNPAKLSEEEVKKIDRIIEWKGSEKLLVYIGGLSDNKGVGELLKTFCAQKPGGWKLLMGGFGKDEEKYKKYVAEKEFENFVYFGGKVSYFSLPHYLRLADAAIDPKNESAESSGKLANLMAAGRPIVCLDNDFNRSRLGENGFYLKKMEDLGNILTNFFASGEIKYNFEGLSEERETQKLFEIFDEISQYDRKRKTVSSD